MGASHPKDPRDAHSASGPVSTSRRRRDHAGLGEPNSLKLYYIILNIKASKEVHGKAS